MNDPARQELAETGSLSNEISLKGDAGLFHALVSGCHVENAAVCAGISERTAYRRLADPTFRKQLDDARQSLRESIIARLADAGNDAIGVLTDLMYGSEDETVKLKAAKTLLDSLLATQKQETVAKNTATSLSANVRLLLIGGFSHGLMCLLAIQLFLSRRLKSEDLTSNSIVLIVQAIQFSC